MKVVAESSAEAVSLDPGQAAPPKLRQWPRNPVAAGLDALAPETLLALAFGIGFGMFECGAGSFAVAGALIGGYSLGFRCYSQRNSEQALPG